MKILNRFLPIAALLMPLVSQAGSSVSGGADTYILSEAFFRSKDPKALIRACYEVAPNFGVPRELVAKTLHWAFAEWQGYILTHDIQYAIWNKGAGIVGNLDLKEGCKGGEDLRAFFGVNDPEVESIKPQLNKPFAFVAETRTLPDTDWKQGVLWIAGPGDVDPVRGLPVWNSKSRYPLDQPYDAFRFAVLHEVGHIYGNNHVDWTVMTPLAGLILSGWTDPSSGSSLGGPKSLQIDQEAELVPNLNLALTRPLKTEYGYKLVNGVKTYGNKNALAEAYASVYGVAPAAAITGTITRLENKSRRPHGRPDEVGKDTGHLEIAFSDGKKIHVHAMSRIAQKNDSAPLFNGQYGNHHRSFGSSFFGWLEAGKGIKKRPVIVNYNMGARITVIDPQRGSTDQPMFVSE